MAFGVKVGKPEKSDLYNSTFNTYLKWEDNQSIKLVVLEPLDRLLHGKIHEIYTGSHPVFIPSVEDESQDLGPHFDKNEARWKGYIPVYAKDVGDSYAIWPMRSSVFRILDNIFADLEEEGVDPIGVVLKVTRTGKGYDTRYHPTPLPGRLDDEKLAELQKRAREDKWWENILPNSYEEAVKSLVSAGFDVEGAGFDISGIDFDDDASDSSDSGDSSASEEPKSEAPQKERAKKAKKPTPKPGDDEELDWDDL